MKRSQINTAIRRMEDLLAKHRISLPPFCHIPPEEWKSLGHEYDEVRDNRLGWDITDYGEDRFDTFGFTLITLRNGNVRDTRYRKPYAEKLLLLEEGQYAPMHFHFAKMEDIINRAGGMVLIRVYGASEDESYAAGPVTVSTDGLTRTVPAGTQIALRPGESITIPPRLYHDFSVLPGEGAVLLGEVSTCNDDENDNRFYENCGRFPAIEEDEPPYRLLCQEYPVCRP